MEPSLNLSACSDVSYRSSLSLSQRLIKCHVVLDVTPSQLVNITDFSEDLAIAVCRVLRHTAAAGSYETSVSIEQLSWRHIALDLNLLQNGLTGAAHTQLQVDVRTSECRICISVHSKIRYRHFERNLNRIAPN